MQRLMPEDVPGAILKCPVLIKNTLVELKRWLMCRGLPCTGNKSDIVGRIENCIKNGMGDNIHPGVDNGVWFELRFPDITSVSLSKTGWREFPSRQIPMSFSLSIIHAYLEKCNVHMTNNEYSDSGGEINANNCNPIILQGQKSWRRGRISYASGHVQQLEDNNHQDVYYFLRSNVTASYKDTIHKVSITLNTASSIVINASCTCKAAACKSCSHIIALLFTLEDYTTLYGFDSVTSTSKLKTWNMGRKRGRYPMQVLEATYPHHAKTKPDRKRFFSMHINTNTVSSSAETSADFLTNLQMMSRPSMFQYILNFKYEDYTLSIHELNVLKTKVANMTLGLVPEAMGPINLSVDQNSPCWNLERRVRITASVAKSFFTAKKLDNIINDHLWKIKDISNIPAIQYGRENEAKALSDYKAITGFEFDVCSVGFVVNNKYPGLGCSPDGLVFNKNGILTRLIEIKCPYKIKDIHPNELDSSIFKQMCYSIDENRNLKIKRNHQYYFQVQLSLAIMDLPSCDFIIWSPKGIIIENIKPDNNLISAITAKLLKIHSTVLLPEFFEMRLPRKLKLICIH